MKADYKKSWQLSLPKSSYLYDERALGAEVPEGWESTFPHVLGGAAGSAQADDAFYNEWEASPYADTYLTKLAENSVDRLGLGKGGGTDFLAISYSSPDHVGHAFGPRSWEIQDVLIRLDKDLAELFAHLDAKVGRGNYVVALSADHGVVPIPEDLQKSGIDAGRLRIPEVQEKIEKALEPFGYTKPAVARIAGEDVYFSTGTYDKLKADPAAMRAVLTAIRSVPGVAEIYRADELQGRPATQSPIRMAEANSYFDGRSGDLFVVPKPYWLASGRADKTRDYGTGHGTPYNYDQHVPVLLMGWGIGHGEFFRRVTPADIAPTLASLCGVTLATRDGRVLAEALRNPSNPARPHPDE
jgi:predicted AlkP superfamily pyrophosphatase or phosphodiesterase